MVHESKSWKPESKTASKEEKVAMKNSKKYLDDDYDDNYESDEEIDEEIKRRYMVNADGEEEDYYQGDDDYYNEEYYEPTKASNNNNNNTSSKKKKNKKKVNTPFSLQQQLPPDETIPSIAPATPQYAERINFEPRVKDCLRLSFDEFRIKTHVILTPNKVWEDTNNQLNHFRYLQQRNDPDGANKKKADALARQLRDIPQYNSSTTVFSKKEKAYSGFLTNILTKRSFMASGMVGSKLFIFGGTDGKSLFNDLHSLDFSTRQWTTYKEMWMNTERNRPPPSAHGAMIAFHSELILFLNYKGNLKPYMITNPTNFSIFWGTMVPNASNPTYMSQEHPPVQGAPISARDDFTVNFVDNCFYIFGGRKGGTSGTDELYAVRRSLRANHNCIFQFERIEPPKNSSATLASIVWPAPRYGHASATIGDSIYIFGGRSNARDFNDLIRFDTQTKLWEEIVIDGCSVPPPLFNHSFAYGNGKLMAFGGFSQNSAQKNIFQFDPNKKNWQLLKAKGHGESPGATASALQKPIAGAATALYGNKVFFVGGHVSESGTCGVLQMNEVFDEGVDSLLTSFLSTKLESGFMADVIFHVDGEDETVSAHKCILGPRSAHLASLFSSSSSNIFEEEKEAAVGIDENDIEAIQKKLEEQLAVSEQLQDGNPKQQHIFISECNRTVLAAYIKFLYTGVLQIQGRDNVESLCNLAEKWGHGDTIKKICSLGAAGGSINLNLAALTKELMEREMSDLINSDKYSDLTLKVGNTSLRAHKLLICRSPYFVSMLTSGMKESTQSEIEFENMNPEAMFEILKFLYTDNNEITPANCVAILVESLMLGLRELGNYCRDVVRQNLTIENVLPVLDLALFYSDLILQRQCIKFAVKNFEDIKRNSKFEEIPKEVQAEIEAAFNKKLQNKAKKIARK